MLTEERHRFILKTLADRQSIDIHHIMDETGSSESTVRRDLSLLEKQGKLKRVFGGAVPLEGEQPVEEKTIELPDKLGQAAARLIERGSHVFLDADENIEGMLPFLADLDLTVVTNRLLYANELSRAGIAVYMLGGRVNAEGAVSGYEAMEAIKQLQFDVCVLGVDGLTREGAIGMKDPERAAFKRLAASRSDRALILLDADALRGQAFVSVPELHDAHILTDVQEPEANGILSPRLLISYV